MRNSRPLQLAAAILVAIFGVWAGARVYSNHEPHRADGPPFAVRTPAGEASPPIPSDFDASFDATPGPAATVPEHLPEFSLADRTGSRTPVSRWAGKSLILNFWATWCAPCRREIPLLKALSGQWAARDVEVVGIAVDYRDKVVAYADALKIPYPLLIGEQDALDVATQFGVASPVFPFTVFTDKRGDVVALYVGELHQPQADLILSVVQKLNDKRVELPEAKRAIADGLHALGPNLTG